MWGLGMLLEVEDLELFFSERLRMFWRLRDSENWSTLMRTVARLHLTLY